jgi:hypothetical protein
VSAATVVTGENRTTQLISTARATGLFYLGLAITGGLGFLLIRPRLFAPDDAATTLAQLLEHEQLARLGIALELGIVVTQALAALWFYRLFRPVDSFAAGAIGVFGVVNAIVILASAAFLATALQVALDPIGDPAASSQLMYVMSDNLWGVGALFFGLWLIPMGQCVLRSGWMPRALGWILIAGGVGYLLSAFVRYLAPDVGALVDLLAVPASVGEFWIIGHLLIRGVNRPALAEEVERSR